MADFLAACKSWDRKFHFCFEGPLLRKGNSPKAKKQRKAREAEVRSEIKAEMERRGRRQFRGQVSVHLAIFGGQAEIPTMVKSYLDCFEGILYADDRAVGHLMVSRYGHGDAEEKVYFGIEPLSMYAASFDHVFASHHHLTAADECFWVEDAPGWGNPFGRHDEMELARLAREIEHHRDEGAELEEEGPDDDRLELIEMLRLHKEEELAALRVKQVLDQPLHYLDRPGRAPGWAAQLSAEDPAVDLADSPDSSELPGSFWLPPRGSSDWKRAARQGLTNRRAQWRLSTTPITRAIGLDIAVQQLKPPGKDLDNLAHEILVPLEEIFCDGERGQVRIYRVYGRSGARPGIRVRLMEAKRLQATHSLIEDAHIERLQPSLS